MSPNQHTCIHDQVQTDLGLLCHKSKLNRYTNQVYGMVCCSLVDGCQYFKGACDSISLLMETTVAVPTCQIEHGVTSQKTTITIFTALKALNLI